MEQEGWGQCSHPSSQGLHESTDKQAKKIRNTNVFRYLSDGLGHTRGYAESNLCVTCTSTLPALQCTGVVMISDVSPLNAGRMSSRSQHMFHMALVSHGTSGFSGRSCIYMYMYMCSIYTVLADAHLLHSRGPPEEEVPLCIRDLASLSHDLSTQHEGEDQFVLLKQPPRALKTAT